MEARQRRLPAGGVLPWHQSKPRSKVASLAEGSSVADGCDNGCCHDRPDPWDLPYASAAGIRGRDPFQFKADHFNLFFDHLPLTPEKTNEVPPLRPPAAPPFLHTTHTPSPA